MIVELKSLLPLIIGNDQEEKKIPPPQLPSPAFAENDFLFPALAEEQKPVSQELSVWDDFHPENRNENLTYSLRGSTPALQENNRITDLLEQLLNVSAKNAESSGRIAELLEQQESGNSLFFN